MSKACGNAANTPAAESEKDPLSREVAAGLAASQQVDTVLVSLIRALGSPLAESQVDGLAAFALIFALAENPDAEPPSIEGCVPTLGDSAGDGYPGMETTLTIDCELFGFRLDGTLVLMDEDDMDAASGFNSEMDLQMTLTADGETLVSFAGDHDLQVTAMEAAMTGAASRPPPTTARCCRCRRRRCSRRPCARRRTAGRVRCRRDRVVVTVRLVCPDCADLPPTLAPPPAWCGRRPV